MAYTPTDAEIERLFPPALATLGSRATLAVIRRVLSANPNTISAFALRERHDVRDPRAEGFIAWLPLTAEGRRALLDGTFAASDPASGHIAGQHDKPAAIYLWALYAPDGLVGGISWAYQQWSTPTNRGADIYARAATPRGHHFVERVGFERIQAPEPGHLQHLFIYRRSLGADPSPPYDSHRPGGRGVSVAVARSFEDLARVISLRAAVYMAEQACPYEEEFDGNDLSATHLIGYVGDEPAGCLRIRFFADFAKIERLAVRAEHRGTKLAAALATAGIELARVKGYRRLYGHAQKRLVGFWSRFGFRVFEGAQELIFSDFDYVEMLMEAEAHPQAIGIGADPYVIIRPEGRWHRAGVLERSAARPVGSAVATAGQQHRAS